MAGRVRRRKKAQPHNPTGARLPPGATENLNRAWGAAANPQGVRRQGASAKVLQTNSDTALKLLEDLRAHRVDPTTLTPNQRRSMLMLLANGKQTSTELAAMFGTSPSTIRNDLKIIRDEVGREVRDWTLPEVLGQLALAAEKCTAEAMRSNDPGLAWTIQRDLAKLLREFGVVEPETRRESFSVTIEAIGSGYERAREVLGRAMDPRLTGAQSPGDTDPEQDQIPRLPLGRTVGAPGTEEDFAVPQNPDPSPQGDGPAEPPGDTGTPPPDQDLRNA